MYIKGLVNTKDQSNACICEMMSKGSKEAFIIIIIIIVYFCSFLYKFSWVFCNLSSYYNLTETVGPWTCRSFSLEVGHLLK